MELGTQHALCLPTLPKEPWKAGISAGRHINWPSATAVPERLLKKKKKKKWDRKKYFIIPKIINQRNIL